jgi:hypothetical protein
MARSASAKTRRTNTKTPNNHGEASYLPSATPELKYAYLHRLVKH